MDSETPHIRRAWTTDGGTHVRFESRSFGNSFFSNARSPVEDDHVFGDTAQHGGRPSLFRTAVSMMAAMHEIRRARAAQQMQDAQTQSRHRKPSMDRRDSQYKSTARARQQSPRDTSAGPPRRGSYRDDSRRDSDAEDSDRRRQADTRSLTRQLRELEADIRDHEAEIDDCSHWLSRNAHRRSISRRRIEEMQRRLRDHRTQLQRAEDEVEAIRARREQLRRESDRPQPRRRRTAPQPSMTAEENMSPEVEEMFQFLFNNLAGGQRRASAPRPGPIPHQLFEHLAGLAGAHFAFADARGQPFAQHFFTSGADPRFAARPTAFTAPTPRSLNLLTKREAEEIYALYNRKWSELAATNPDVPFPGRELKSAALLATDSIHAPAVSSPLSAWSTEDVVRANTQSFFLTLVGFSPTFQDRAGKIEMDFNHSRAAPDQLQALADMLKKEKLRWHSDKLGRRNGGEPGMNTALQQNEVARGVFHAVCQLSDLVQSKR